MKPAIREGWNRLIHDGGLEVVSDATDRWLAGIILRRLIIEAHAEDRAVIINPWLAETIASLLSPEILQ